MRAVASVALDYPFPPHWRFSALNFQAQTQGPCIPVSALMGHFPSCLPELNHHHLTMNQHPQTLTCPTPAAEWKIQQTDEGSEPASYEEKALQFWLS